MIRIRLGVPADAPGLPAIEDSAGDRFRSLPALAWVADHGNMPEALHRTLIALGTEWVAVDDDDRPVAFLGAEVVDGALHIWEFSVRLDRQGQGIGRALLDAAVAYAVEHGLPALTLTTFRDVAWNEPFYHRRGFVTLAAHEVGEALQQIMARDAAHGLPLEQRCAMRLAL